MPPGSRAIREREREREREKQENTVEMERGEGMGSDVEREEKGGEQEEDAAADLLRDRFRLCTISIAESEEQLAKDLELFSQHAGRKSVNMEDVILSAHRNDHLAALLRVFCNDLKVKEPQSERKWKKGPRKDKAAEVNQSEMKRKKGTRKEDKAVAGEAIHIADL